MNILKIYSVLTLFLIANSNSIYAGNPFRFPTESSKGITITKEIPTETNTTQSNNQTQNNNQAPNDNQIQNNNQIQSNNHTENNNQTQNNNQIRNNNQTQNNNQTEGNIHTEVNIESFCGGQPDGEYNCVDPPGYPEQNILEAVASQQSILKSFFDEEIISTTMKPSRIQYGSEESVITGLFGIFGPSNNMSDYNEEKAEYDQSASDSPPLIEEQYKNICSSRSDHIRPRAARNNRGEFQFIVNHPGGNNSFIQKVEVSECVNANKECGDGELFDARTECHQEFLEHKLVAVSRDGGQVVVDTFKFPSCCTCRIINHGL